MSEIGEPVLSLAFSGGFDSTGMLIYALESLSGNIEVQTFNFNDTDEDKAGVEASKKIVEALNEKFFGRIIKHKFQNFDLACSHTDHGQAVLMASVLPMASWSNQVWMGYIRGDDIWHYKGELMRIFNYSASIVQRTNMSNLHFPSEWMTKTEIYKQFYSRHEDIHELVYFPEHKVESGEYDDIPKKRQVI